MAHGEIRKHHTASDAPAHSFISRTAPFLEAALQRTPFHVQDTRTGDTTERLAAHKVRSTTHLQEMPLNPRWSAGLRTISIVVRNVSFAQSTSRPARSWSANTCVRTPATING